MTTPGPRLFFFLTIALLAAGALRAEDVPVEKVFAAVPYEQWVKQGPQVKIPWKVYVEPFGLSLHQRLRAHVAVVLKRRELAKFAPEDRILMLIEVKDAAGQPFRDYAAFSIRDMGPQIRKGEIDVYWNAYVLPGEYTVTVVLVNGRSGEHNLKRTALRVDPLKDDPLPGAWDGLPEVEFLDPYMEGPDAMFRPDVSGKLHLPLASAHPVRMEVLADVTASDLFRGSTAFYNRYLSVALPLLKLLSQISLERGAIDVAMLDLRKRAITFEQDDVKELDWKRAKAVLAPENGPATIDVKALEKRRESPAFLQDELLRRLNGPGAGTEREAPMHVFVIIGSPMDFYSFRDLPRLPAGLEEKCVVYYLQFELLNPAYADGAVGNVRKMLKPLPVRTFKVRSAESIRRALAKILEETSSL